MNEQSRLTDHQSHILIQTYGGWPPPSTAPPTLPPYEDPVPFSFQSYRRPAFVPVRTDWMALKPDKRNQIRGNDTYTAPNSNNNQPKNRANKARNFHSNKKKRPDKIVPFAPRNTTSFIIRAKKAGGIASLVSPYAVTPAILPTPKFSPSKEVLVDMAKEEWGVDGYGSMNGLIRLRSPHDDDEDLSRFELKCPSYGYEHSGTVLSNRVDDQDTHIEQLEEENVSLKERLFLMESEVEDMKMRVHCLEIIRGRVRYDVNEEGSEINGWDIEGDDDVNSEKTVGDGDGN